MNTINQNERQAEKAPRISQLRVRCDVRAGEDLATCQWNVNKWRQRYQEAYNQARQRGCI